MSAATAKKRFWDRFIHHEPELCNFDPKWIVERERIFDETAIELQKVDPDLSFEFGPNGKPQREFVISAGGRRRGFPAVVLLTDAAPPLKRWRVIAPRDVQFSLCDTGKIARIYLFIPGFRADDADLKIIGYILLDEALGEYDVESHLGLVEMYSPQTPTEGNRHPLADLPSLFDLFVSRTEGRIAKSS
jgi:hypothetical protein